MRRKEQAARSITQSNDAGSFNASSNDQNGSRHNKRAKRHSSKRLRQALKDELQKDLDDTRTQEDGPKGNPAK